MAAIVTSKGREIIVNQMRALGTEPKYISWGFNPNNLTAAVTDISLYSPAPEARVLGISSIVTTTTANDTYQLTGTLTAASDQTIGEISLHDSSTKPAIAVVAAGGVVGSAVATTLNTLSGFAPGNNNYIQIRTEVMKIVSGSGSTVLTVIRAQNGTSAISTIATADIINQANPPSQTGVTGGNMFFHADFAGIILNAGDSIPFTIQIKYS